jgi:Carboxypeptidase regulatory-like domain
MTDFVVGGLHQDQPRLVVHAIDPFGLVLAGAAVLVEHDREKVADVRTDAAGQAILEGLPAGKGRVRVDLAGFRPVDMTVRLRRGCVTAVILPMEVGSMVESTGTSRP